MPKTKNREGYTLMAGKRGSVVIPKAYHRVMGISVFGGAYIHIVRTGRYSLLITPDSRREWEPIPEGEEEEPKLDLERGLKAEQKSQAKPESEPEPEPDPSSYLSGVDLFVHENLRFQPGSEIPTRAVQERYSAWAEANKDTFWKTNAAHLGRAIKKILSGVKRGRLKGSSSDQFISAYHNLAFCSSSGEGPDIPIVITEDEPDGEPPTIITDDQVES